MISNFVATSKALHLLVCAVSDEDHKLLNTVLLCSSYGTHDVKSHTQWLAQQHCYIFAWEIAALKVQAE